jgi:hypothetical protein
VRKGGIGKLKEQSLLARYAFEILEELTLDLALWPHLTVEGNLEFGLKAQGLPRP